MRTLSEGLAELAEEAPDARPDPGLWERGRRYGRRRRTGSAVIAVAAVAVLVALLAVTWVRLPPAPAPLPPAGEPAGLPDRLYDPSPWLPDTAEEGPLGRLAATISAERGSWTGGGTGLVGVSAVTGEYRFLDLPDAVDMIDPLHSALSPDGRRVAYWTTGEPAASAHTRSGSITGVAVYDAETGDVTRHEIPTEHGVWPSTLLWADPETLVIECGQWRGGEGDRAVLQASGRLDPTLLWRLGEEPRVLPGPPSRDVVSAGGGRLLVRGDGYRLQALADGEVLRRLRIVDDTSREPVLDTSGRRLAVVAGADRDGIPSTGGRNPNAVLVGAVPADGAAVRLRRVPDSGRTFEVLAWVDEHRLALRRSVAAGTMRTAVDLLDVRDGSAERLVLLPGDGLGSAHQLARDLLGAPTVEATEPPRPLDPRLVAGGIAATIVVSTAAVLLWRRRVQP